MSSVGRVLLERLLEVIEVGGAKREWPDSVVEPPELERRKLYIVKIIRLTTEFYIFSDFHLSLHSGRCLW